MFNSNNPDTPDVDDLDFKFNQALDYAVFVYREKQEESYMENNND
jgi:hypothetical protein